jgi:hypothetical protein
MRTLTINGDPSVSKFTVFQYPGKTAAPVAGFKEIRLASTASPTRATLDYHVSATSDKLKPFTNFEPNKGYCTYSSKQFTIEADNTSLAVPTKLTLVPSGTFYGWNIIDYPFAASLPLSSFPQIRLVKTPAASRQNINFAVYQGHLPPTANEVTRFEPGKSYMVLVSSELVINNPVPPTPTPLPPTATPPKPTPTPTPTPLPLIASFTLKHKPASELSFVFIGAMETVLNAAVGKTIDGNNSRTDHIKSHSPFLGTLNREVEIVMGTGQKYSFYMGSESQDWLVRRNDATGKWSLVGYFGLGQKAGADLAFTNSHKGQMQWGTDGANSCSWEPLLRPDADYLNASNILRFLGGLAPLPAIVAFTGTLIGAHSNTESDLVLTF